MNPVVAGILVRLLSSRAGGVAAAVVSRCPELWRRVALKPVLPPVRPAGTERLKTLVPGRGDLARLMYSMALAYLDRDEQAFDSRSLACLRTADFLGFEGSERVSLYRMVVAARRGDHHEVTRLRESVEPADLTAAELALLDTPPRPLSVVQGDPDRRGGVVALLGDAAAARSHWYADGRMVWVSSGDNGLSPRWLAALGIVFDAAIGDAASLAEARAAGVRSQAWLEV